MELSATVQGKRKHAPHVSKAIAFLLMSFCWPLISWAQDAGSIKISIQAQQKKLSEVFAEIEQKSGFTIEFQHDVINKDKLVNIKATDEPVQKIMQKLLNGSSTRLVQQGKSILIVKEKKPEQSLTEKKGPGRVAGLIVDEENGQPVAGVTILIGSKSVASAVDGSYSISLPAGNYTATLTSVGYAAKEITDIEVEDNKVYSLNITMKREKGQLAGVVVRASARRESVASLYARQKNSPNISDGISQEQMARTPDKNLGEALRRISGISTMENKYPVVRGLSERYNVAELNGQPLPSTELNRKAFSFDIIPSSLVDVVTVSKTLTPDKNAEFGGGLIQVETKSIPDQNFFSISVGGSFNDKTTGKKFLSLPLENRNYFALPAKHRNLFGKLGWKDPNEILGNRDLTTPTPGTGLGAKVNDPSEFANNWQPEQLNAPVSPNFQLSGGRVFHLKNNDRIGFVGAVTWRNTFQTGDVLYTRNGFDYDISKPMVTQRYGFTTNLSVLAGISYATKKHKITYNSLFLRTLDQQFLMGAASKDSRYQIGLFDVTTFSSFWQNQLRGEHNIGKSGIRFNWMLSQIDLNRQRPDNHMTTGLFLREEYEKNGEIYLGGIWSNFSDAGGLRSWSSADEKSYSWNFDVLVPFRFKMLGLDWNNSFKTGNAGWNKHRNFYVLNTGHSNPDFMYYPSLNDYFSPDREGLYVNLSQFNDQFDKHATLQAFYGMLDTKIAEKLRITGGLRAEYLNTNAINVQLEVAKKASPSFDFSELEKREPNWNLLPSFNLTYSITPKLNLRGGFFKSLIRPDLRELSYFQEYDFELGGMYWSNTLVRSTRIKHYDLRLEWYPGPGEVLSLSVFKKEFDYPMEIFKMDGNREFRLKNNKYALNEGIEAEVRKSLAFTKLPVLRNITLYGNIALLRGKVTPMNFTYKDNDPNFPNKILTLEQIEKDEERLQSGASPLMYNAGLYYDQKPISLSVTYNYVASRMFRPVIPYTNSVYEQPLASLDAQVSVKFLKNKAEIRATISNILDNSSLTYLNLFDKPVTDGGEVIRKPSVKETNYKEGQDNIDFKYSPGRTISLTFTYNL